MFSLPANHKRIVATLLAFVVAVFLQAQLFVPLAIASDPKPAKGHGAEPKKASADGAKKKKKKKKKKDEPEKVAEEKPIGSESAVGNKQFDDDAEQAGKVDAVLVLDSSRSMQRTDPQRLRDQAAKLFIRFLGNGDRVAIMQFDREAKLLVPLTDIDPGSIPGLDSSIETAPMEGGFTDLEVALEEALKLLLQEGRKDSTKTVVLLSDGKMDPHPSRGTSAEMTEKVISVDLPEFRDKNIKLYTVAFSEESDRKLLSEFATDGGGLGWFAPDAGTIHKKFSELFLTLKRPQVVPLEGEGFEVDSSVHEATFYISRKESQGEVTLVDPRGTEINSRNIPPGTKWFRGDLFDVVTIGNPFPGRWTVRGLESAEGFATFLSDIKLQVKWPQSSFKTGDSVVVYARLINGTQELVKTELEDITFYTYKIVNSDNGTILMTGALNDKGEDGDAKLGDGIFSTTLKLDKDGEYQGLFGITSPTFTRQQRVSFTVSAGLVGIKVIPPDDFAGTPETLQAVLAKDPSDLKSVKLQLVAQKAGSEKPVGITLKPRANSPEIYDIPMEKLGAGEYELSVRYTAVDEKKKQISGSSETVKYTIHPHPGDVEHGGEEESLEELPEAHEPESKTDWSAIIVGILGILLAGAWMGGLAFFSLKKASGKKAIVEVRQPYVVPEALAQRIQLIKSNVGNARRRVTMVDRDVFELVADGYAKDESGGGDEGGAATGSHEEQPS